MQTLNYNALSHDSWVPYPLRSRFILLLAVTLLAGCESFNYYHQAASGHLSILAKKKPISEYITAQDTSPALKGQLNKVLALRRFADQQLALPVKGQYSSYAELNRRYVVWNVFAAPALSTQARQWCYPVIGCASYRGYYSRTNAQTYAEKLSSQGLDVYLAGVTAYSTLGWFNDPVLNTFIQRSDAELANLIFHELAHQVLYAKGDTVFNESFATVVAKEGVKRWLQHQNNLAAYHRFIQYQERHDQFIALVISHRDKLQTLYDTDANDGQKKQGKTGILLALKDQHRKLKQSWGGRSDYDRWFNHDLNNAQLNTVAAYNELVPAFEALLAQYNGDLTTFYTHAKRLALIGHEKRKQNWLPITQAYLLKQAD